MELFLKLVCTVFLSFLLSGILAKLLSTPSHKVQDKGSVLKSCEDVIQKERKTGFDLTNKGGEFVKEVVEVREFRGELEKGDVKVKDLVTRSCELAEESDGAEKIRLDDHVDEESLEENEDVENLLDEIPTRCILDENEIELVNDEFNVIEPKEFEVLKCKVGQDSGNEGKETNADYMKEGLSASGDENDWEGIESTELERIFGAAVAYLGSRMNADQISKLGRDVKLQLYGLHKVATVGPCHEPQPMAWRLSARAKWNAWRCLENMSPESAMEQYLTLLTGSIPGWMQDDPNEGGKQISRVADA